MALGLQARQGHQGQREGEGEASAIPEGEASSRGQEAEGQEGEEGLCCRLPGIPTLRRCGATPSQVRPAPETPD